MTWRIRPSVPVMQNAQPTAQPTWLDTHTPSRGSSTLSTVWPSCRPSSRRAAPSSAGVLAAQLHLAVPLRQQFGQGGHQRRRQPAGQRRLAWVQRQRANGAAPALHGRAWRRGRGVAVAGAEICMGPGLSALCSRAEWPGGFDDGTVLRTRSQPVWAPGQALTAPSNTCRWQGVR